MPYAPTQPEVIAADAGSRTESYFRVQIDGRVKYLTIAPETLTNEELMLPLYEIPELPWTDDTWTVAYIQRSASGVLESRLSNKKLAGVKALWHSNMVSWFSLKQAERYNFMTFKCTRGTGQPFYVAKIASFEFEIPYFEQETAMYHRLEGSGIAPRFLGHIHESERPIGMLLEYLDGRSAGIEDLAKCQAVLKRLHDLGYLHGDVNRYSFIVCEDSKAYLIDFTKSRKECTPEELAAEMASLQDKLQDESGVGAPFGALSPTAHQVGEEELEHE